MSGKIRFLTFVFIFLFAGAFLRLFYWQVIKGSELSQDARGQYTSSTITQAPRGNILANDGSFWVLRTDVWTVYADSKKIKETPRLISEKIAPLFVETDSKADLLAESQRIESLLSKNSSYIVIKNRVNSDIKKSLEGLKIAGINFDVNESRFYPEASSAAQILGFVGKNDIGESVGYFGLEGYYNLSLSGKSGLTKRQKDAQGSTIIVDQSKNITAISGVDLVTSIDKRIQILIESKLKEGIEKYGASGGNITVMNPNTGEILAMASSPTFDPGSYWEYGDSVFRNPVISDTFEPGSIMKVVVMASGLDAEVVKPDTPCDICGQPLKLDKYLIKTWNNEYHNDISMTDVIVHSDNVGMSFVGQKLGADRLYDYLDKFGFGKPTGVDLQGEVASPMRQKGTWSIVDTATASFGQGIAVTGMQMIKAVSAIANGGYLVTPRIVSKIQSEDWTDSLSGGRPKRIISQDAARSITEMMVKAVDNGEAKWTRTPGYQIAGKTGTAQIAVEGHYDTVNTNHSFIGFAPASKPEFIMLVTLKTPQSSPWASETAAPLWFSVAKDIFPYLGIAPSE